MPFCATAQAPKRVYFTFARIALFLGTSAGLAVIGTVLCPYFGPSPDFLTWLFEPGFAIVLTYLPRTLDRLVFNLMVVTLVNFPYYLFVVLVLDRVLWVSEGRRLQPQERPK
jgi:hypothetical protein